VLAACSSSTTKPTSKPAGLPVAEIPKAVAAVEQKLGGAQTYSEINANATGVNMFVLGADGTERVYSYANGVLDEPDPPVPAEGNGFAATDVALDKGPSLVRKVEKKLKGSTVEQVAIVIVKPEGLVWGIRSRSAKGGQVNNLFGPDGRLLSVAPVP
jgi:hypothetical protein